MIDTALHELTWIEVSYENVKHNIEALASKVGDVGKICAVVKGNAYGHGIDFMVPALQRSGVRIYAVYHPDEALKVRELVGSEPLVMLLGYMRLDEVSSMVGAGIECLLLNRERLSDIHDRVPVGRSLNIHLKVDTGMNRFGLVPQDVRAFVEEIRFYDRLKLTGVASHFANSWNIEDPSYAENQKTLFSEALSMLEPVNGSLRYCHMSNTAALFVHPDARFDFVRTGIGIYGYYPNKAVKVKYDEDTGLKPVLSFYSTVISIKNLEAGEYAGYDIAFQADRPTKIALAPVGYSDGFPFGHSGQGAFVLVRGQRVPLIGRVNMNAIFLDVTDVPGVKSGERITLLGQDGDEEVSVWDWVEWGTPHLYEALTKLRPTLPRIVV